GPVRPPPEKGIPLRPIPRPARPVRAARRGGRARDPSPPAPTLEVPMPPPDTNDSSPGISTGYRPPRFLDTTLTLDPSLATLAPPYNPGLGWYAQPRLSYSRLHLGLTYGDLDDVLAPYVSQLSLLST